MEGGTGTGAEDHKKGLWTAEEDKVLTDYVKLHGKGQWNRIANKTGLKRCGKSCRLRWMNYLSPTVNRGSFTVEEEDLIARLHKLIGNRWSLIAKRVPGRTDNQVKNYWNTHLSKKLGIKKHRNGNNRSRNAVLSIVQKDDNKVCDTSASSTLSHVNTSGSDETMVDRGVGQEHEALVVEKMTTSQSYADSICDFDYEFELSTIDLLNHYAAGAGFDWQCL